MIQPSSSPPRSAKAVAPIGFAPCEGLVTDERLDGVVVEAGRHGRSERLSSLFMLKPSFQCFSRRAVYHRIVAVERSVLIARAGIQRARGRPVTADGKNQAAHARVQNRPLVSA